MKKYKYCLPYKTFRKGYQLFIRAKNIKLFINNSGTIQLARIDIDDFYLIFPIYIDISSKGTVMLVKKTDIDLGIITILEHLKCVNITNADMHVSKSVFKELTDKLWYFTG